MHKVKTEEAASRNEQIRQMINSFDKQQMQQAENNRYRFETILKDFGTDLGLTKSESELFYSFIDGIKDYYDIRGMIIRGIEPSDVYGLNFSNNSFTGLGPPYLIKPNELSFPLNFVVCKLQSTVEKVVDFYEMLNKDKDSVDLYRQDSDEKENITELTLSTSFDCVEYLMLNMIQNNSINQQNHNPYMNESYMTQMQNVIQSRQRQDYNQNPNTPNTA